MLKRINPDEITENVFDMLDRRWMLLSAGYGGVVNPMTVSWGGLGVLWNKRVVTVYVRPTRYTFELLEKSGIFTLSLFDEARRDALLFCGSHTGRGIDKPGEAGLTVSETEDGVPFYEEAVMTIVCKKIYSSDLEPARFLDDGIEGNYPEKDYHRMYIGEIAGCFIKE